MTSHEFEKAAKNAVIKVLNENINIDQLDLVWFATMNLVIKSVRFGEVQWMQDMRRLHITEIRMKCMLIFIERLVIQKFHPVNLTLKLNVLIKWWRKIVVNIR